MEEMILEFVKLYGWKLAIIACSGILILGVLKFFNVFGKIQKEKRKYLYAVISSALSITASAIYLVAIKQFNIAGFGVIAGAIYVLNQAIYSIYENYGIRVGLRKLGNVIINIVAKNQIEEAKEEIKEEVVVNDTDIKEI